MSRYLFFCFVVIAVPCPGQEVTALSRFDDQFDTVRYGQYKYSPFPGLKSIALDQGTQEKVSFGGELREQFQIFENENWGTQTDPNRSNSGKVFNLHRLMLFGNIQVTKYFRLFGELKNNLESGRVTGPRPSIDEDQLDVHQLFADLILYPGSGSTLTTRIGRQELNYGASRLISVNDGLNARLSFQGYKLVFKQKDLQVDGIYVNPVSNIRGTFDNRINRNEYLYGVYAAGLLPVKGSVKIDAYYFFSKNEKEVYYHVTGKETRQSYGLRVISDPEKAFNYDAEYILQTGKLDVKKIRAFMAVLVLGYRFTKKNLKPSVSLVGQIASGNAGKSDQLNSFNPLYARVYYGLGMPYWSSNLIQLSPVFKVEPSEKISVDWDIRALWRHRLRDGLYFPGGPARSPFFSNSATPSPKRIVGFQYDFNVTYKPLLYLSFAANISGLPASGYIRDTGTGKDIFFTNLQARFKF